MKIVNKTGYLKGTKTAKNPVNVIPSNLITTQGMAFPIKANGKTLYPNTGQYKFSTPYVVETPLKQEGANELVPDKMSKTKLSKAQEIAYQKWRKFKGYNESDDYDMRGFWKKQGFKNLGSPKGGEHFTDEFKRLAPFSEGDNYPTLSDESNVASKFDKRMQGTWTKDDKYINYQDGSEELKASEAAKFTYRIKDKKRRDTQVRDMYNNTLDSFRGDTTGAKRHFKDFFTHYGSERFDGVRPLEGYYGFDRKDYNDKTLDSLGRNWHKQMKTSKKQEGTQAAKANLFPKPTIGVQAKNIKKYINSRAFKKQVEDKKKEERLKFENAKRFPQRASGKVDMTAGPLDAVAVGAAGIPSLAGRTLTSVLPKVAGALNTPLTTAIPGVTAGNMLGSYAAADAMVNRLPKVPGQIKRKEYGAAAENTITGALDLLGAGMIKTSPVKFGSKSKIKYSVNPNTNVSNKVEANVIAKPKINFEDLKKSIKKDFSPDDFTNAVTEKFTYRDPHTNEIVYQLDPEDYNNFTNPDDIKLAKSHFDEYVNEHKANIVKNQEEVVQEALRLINPKVPLVKKSDFYTNSEVRQISKNSKDFKNLEKEISDINPNLENEEDLSKIFLIRPDLEKRWYSMMEHGKTFDKKFLTPSQQKYLDKQTGYVSGTSKPLLMPSGSRVNEGVYPSPKDIKITRFPIRFGPESVNKEGNKSLKSNLIKYKNGSKSVSLAFSRGEKDPKGGLTQKGVDKYNRATGGNLKMAVTTPPSKLKPGSKAANRRKSFCARMSGVKGPMAKNGKPTRKALALRKWNC